MLENNIVEWLLSRPWLPFLIMGILIVLAVFVKLYLIKLLIKLIKTAKKEKQNCKRKDRYKKTGSHIKASCFNIYEIVFPLTSE